MKTGLLFLLPLAAFLPLSAHAENAEKTSSQETAAAPANAAGNGESVSQSSASASDTTKNVDTNTGTGGATGDVTAGASTNGDGVDAKATKADPAAEKGTQ